MAKYTTISDVPANSLTFLPQAIVHTDLQDSNFVIDGDKYSESIDSISLDNVVNELPYIPVYKLFVGPQAQHYIYFIGLNLNVEFNSVGETSVNTGSGTMTSDTGGMINYTGFFWCGLDLTSDVASDYSTVTVFPNYSIELLWNLQNGDYYLVSKDSADLMYNYIQNATSLEV